MLSICDNEKACRENVDHTDEENEAAIYASAPQASTTGDPLPRQCTNNRDEAQNGETDVSGRNEVTAGRERKTV